MTGIPLPHLLEAFYFKDFIDVFSRIDFSYCCLELICIYENYAVFLILTDSKIMNNILQNMRETVSNKISHKPPKYKVSPSLSPKPLRIQQANKQNIAIQTKLPFKDECDFGEQMIDEHVEAQNHQPSQIMIFNCINSLTVSTLTQRVEGKSIHQSSVRRRENSLSINKLQEEKQQLQASKQRRQEKRSTENLKQIKKKQQKIAQMRIQMQAKQMRQCTFKPNLSHTSQYNSKKESQGEKQKQTRTVPQKQNTPAQPQETVHTKKKKEIKKQVGSSAQFLKNQKDHLQKIAKKKEEMRKELERIAKQEQSFSPNINKVSKTRRNKAPAHQRLYQLKDKKVLQEFLNSNQVKTPQRSVSPSSKSNCSPSFGHHNKTSKPRKQFRGELLYKDAVRRSTFQKDLPEKNESEEALHKKSTTKQQENQTSNFPQNSSRTQKLLIQKFIREYSLVLEEVGLTMQNTLTLKSYINCSDHGSLLPSYQQSYENDAYNDDTFNQVPFSYQQLSKEMHNRIINHEQFNVILNKMNFLVYDLRDETELAYKERSLAYEAYCYIQEQHQRVTITYLAGFLLALIGVYRINSQKQSILMDKCKGSNVHKYFKNLNQNRLYSQKRNKGYQQQVSPIKIGQNPRHKEYRDSLAQRFREKILLKTNRKLEQNQANVPEITADQLTHEDFLTILKLGHTLELESKRQLLMMQKQKQCTFHPSINFDSSKIETSRSIGNKKSEQLYTNAKKRQDQQLEKQIEKINEEAARKEAEKMNRKIKLTKPRKSFKKLQIVQGDEQKQQSQCNTARLNAVPAVKNTIKNWNFGKDTQKAVIRMRQSYLQREQKQRFLERGEKSYSHKRKTSNISNISAKSKRTLQKESSNTVSIEQQKKFIHPETFINQFEHEPEQHDNTNKSRITHMENDEEYSMDNFLTGDQIIINNQDEQFHQSVKHDWQIDENQREVSNEAAEKERDPFLIIDINMGNSSIGSQSYRDSSEDQVEQLYFYLGDEANIGKIVDKFCTKHKLDESNKQYLLMMVEREMATLLNNFGIQSTLEDH